VRGYCGEAHALGMASGGGGGGVGGGGGGKTTNKGRPSVAEHVVGPPAIYAAAGPGGAMSASKRAPHSRRTPVPIVVLTNAETEVVRSGARRATCRQCCAISDQSIIWRWKESHGAGNYGGVQPRGGCFRARFAGTGVIPTGSGQSRVSEGDLERMLRTSEAGNGAGVPSARHLRIKTSSMVPIGLQAGRQPH